MKGKFLLLGAGFTGVITFLYIIIYSKIIEHFNEQLNPLEKGLCDYIAAEKNKKENKGKYFFDLDIQLVRYFHKQLNHDISLKHTKIYQYDLSIEENYKKITDQLMITFKKRIVFITQLNSLIFILLVMNLVVIVINLVFPKYIFFYENLPIQYILYFSTIGFIIIPVENYFQNKQVNVIIGIPLTFAFTTFSYFLNEHHENPIIDILLTGKVNISPSNFFLLGYIVISFIAYIIQYSLKMKLINKVLNGGYLEGKI